jgi:hypothetical protein
LDQSGTDSSLQVNIQPTGSQSSDSGQYLVTVTPQSSASATVSTEHVAATPATSAQPVTSAATVAPAPAVETEPAPAPVAATNPSPTPAPTPDASPASSTLAASDAPAAVPKASEPFTTLEMNAVGGTVTFSNLTSPSTNTLNVGDEWELSITGGPPNTPLLQLMNNYTYPPQFETVGVTNASGDLTLTGTITQSQAGTAVYQPFYLQFPNSVGGYNVSDPGYQDPNAPAGLRNVLVGLVAYSVNS